jgi:hypothetical protein
VRGGEGEAGSKGGRFGVENQGRREKDKKREKNHGLSQNVTSV